LALDGTTLLAGSEPMGSIRVFENAGGTWNETTTLAAYDATPGDAFGFAVDVDGDRIAVASHLDDDAGKNSGSIYTYRRVGGAWVTEAKVVPPGYRADEHYGQYIALAGDLLVGTSDFADSGLGASYITSLADPVSCLGTSTLEVELNPGVFQEMAYVGSAALAGNAYFVLGSLSGVSPGVTTQGVHIPLNIDVYTEVSILFANFAPFIQFQGTLDANGAANPRFEVPAGGLPASAVGVTLHHALLVVSGASLVAATDAVPVILK